MMKIKKLFKAIITAHRLRSQRLNVRYYTNGSAEWECDKDIKWVRYKKSLEIVYSLCKPLYKILTKLRAI